MENVNLSQANKAYLSNQQNNISKPIEQKEPAKQIKDGDEKLKKALVGLAVAGAVVAIGAGVYFGKIKPKKAIEQIKNAPNNEITEQITDITQGGISKLLKENDKLTGKFSKTMKDGSKVVVEYSDGILKKSTKTAKDGTQIFEKIYEQTDKGLFVNGKNITEITESAKAHQIKTKQETIEKAAKEVQERATEEAQEAAEELAKENEKKFYELIGKSHVTIDELKKVDTSSLTHEQVEILNKKMQLLEDMAQAEKAFKDSARKTMPTEEGRLKELAQIYPPGSPDYEECLQVYKDEEMYLDMLWETADEYKSFVLKNKKSFLSPKDETYFLELKKQLKELNIDYSEYELYTNDWNRIYSSINSARSMSINQLNEMLRGGSEVPLEAKILDAQFEQVKPLAETRTFYRNLNLTQTPFSVKNAAKRKDYLQGIKQAKKGEILPPDKGYGYFSDRIIGSFIDKEGVRMKVIAPPGTKIQGISEIVFPRNSKFKVLEPAKIADDGILEILLEYIVP